MDDLISESKTNAPEYSVSELSGALKRTVEDAFGNVRVRGEISGYRGPHSSGHAYFSLKDDRAKIDAIVWKGTMGRLRFRPEEGHGGDRHRQAHHLSRKIVLPDRDRQSRTGRCRRADGAARRAQAQARRRRSVRRRAQAVAALHAARDRRGDVADGRGDPRHRPPHQGPLSAACHRLAGARAGRDLGRGSGGGGRRLQRAAAGRRRSRGPT